MIRVESQTPLSLSSSLIDLRHIERNSVLTQILILFLIAIPAALIPLSEARALAINSCESTFSVHITKPNSQKHRLHSQRQIQELVQLIISTQTKGLSSSKRRSLLAEAQRIYIELKTANPQVDELIHTEWRDRVSGSARAVYDRRLKLEADIRTLEEKLQVFRSQTKSLEDWGIIKDSDEGLNTKSELFALIRNKSRQKNEGLVLRVRADRYIVADHINPPVEFEARDASGHNSWVIGAHALPDERIVSWSGDNTLIFWKRLNGDFVVDQRLGDANTTNPKKGHTGFISGARLLSDGRVLSWSADHTLILWKLQRGQFIIQQRLGEPQNKDPLKGHTGFVRGALYLADGRILSWSEDHTLILWKLKGRKFVVDYRIGKERNSDPNAGHVDGVFGGQLLADGTILSWSRDQTLILWKEEGGAFKVHQKLGDPANTDPKRGHTAWINGAELLTDGEILSWSDDRTLIYWKATGAQFLIDQRVGQPDNILPEAGHIESILQTHILPDGQLVSSDRNGRYLLWGIVVPQAIQKKLDRQLQELDLLKEDLMRIEARLNSSIDASDWGPP